MPDHELYDNDLRVREREAGRFTVFPDGGAPPVSAAHFWSIVLAGRSADAGEPWPDDLRAQCANEAEWRDAFAFGTANAAVVVIWNRPGVEGERAAVEPIEPPVPTLGGVAHAHVRCHGPRLRYDQSWRGLTTYLTRGLSPLRLRDPLSMVMTVCLNPVFARTGVSDASANLRGLERGGVVDRVIDVTQPILTLACGNPVGEAIAAARWQPSKGELRFVSHPSIWTRRRDGERTIVPLLSQWAATGSVPQI